MSRIFKSTFSAVIALVVVLLLGTSPALAGGIVTEVKPKAPNTGKLSRSTAESGTTSSMTSADIKRRRAYEAIVAISVGLMESNGQDDNGTTLPPTNYAPEGDAAGGCAAAPGASNGTGLLLLAGAALLRRRRR